MLIKDSIEDSTVEEIHAFSPKTIEKIYTIANNAIYFNDNHDYLTVLYEICELLKPNHKHGKKCL